MSGPTMQQYVDEAIRQASLDIRVCMPASVESYDADTHTASVRPLLLRRFYGDDQGSRMPVIPGVPVLHPRTAGALIRLPVASGDIVTLVFADRSLDQWLAGDGSEKDPEDLRAHHITDAYAILGGYPPTQSFTAAHPDALEIVVRAGTKVTIGNGTDELIAVAHAAFTDLSSLCQQLSLALTQAALITVTGVTSGSGASGPPANAAAFTAIKSTVDTIKSDVDTRLSSLANLKA